MDYGPAPLEWTQKRICNKYLNLWKFQKLWYLLQIGTNNRDENCEDIKNDCATYAEDLCYGFYGDWMMLFCQKFCDACDSTCKDDPKHAANCDNWATLYCKNPTYEKWMAEHCKKTCNDMFTLQDFVIILVKTRSNMQKNALVGQRMDIAIMKIIMNLCC